MKNIMKRYAIKVKNLDKNTVSSKIETELGKVLGINRVKTNINSGKVEVDYNLKFINYKGIERKLSEIGFPPDKGILHSLRKEFIMFTEKNETADLNVNFTKYTVRIEDKGTKN